MSLEAKEIAEELGVANSFHAAVQAQIRIEFLATYMIAARCRALVLGISGGVDSTAAGRMAQLAVEHVRSRGHEASFIAMRLPYGSQADEADAQAALSFIPADEGLTINIRPAAGAMLQNLRDSGQKFATPADEDFVLGNIKARQRMIAQYAVAGARGGLVIGTDHAAEAVMGFFTKFGDGACDVAPLSGLTKRRVRAVARRLGAPAHLVDKAPTADLESLRPQVPDETAYGVTYEQIDDFLEGKPVSPEAAAVIERAYLATRHKRALPVHPSSDERIYGKRA